MNDYGHDNGMANGAMAHWDAICEAGDRYEDAILAKCDEMVDHDGDRFELVLDLLDYSDVSDAIAAISNPNTKTDDATLLRLARLLNRAGTSAMRAIAATQVSQ